VGFDEPSLPSGKGLPARLDPGKYLVDLFSVGVNKLQAPEIEFLETVLSLGVLGDRFAETYKVFLGLVPQFSNLRSVCRRWGKDTVSCGFAVVYLR